MRRKLALDLAVALLVSACGPLGGAPPPSGSADLDVHLEPSAPVAVRVIDFSYDRSTTLGDLTGSFSLELPGLDDRVRMVILDATGKHLAQLPDRDLTALWISPAGCDTTQPICHVEVRVLFELADPSATIDLSGTVRWQFECLPDCSAAWSPPPSAEPISIHVTDQAPASAAATVVRTTIDSGQVTLSADRPIAVYRMKLHLPAISKPSDPASLIAPLVKLTADGLDLTDPGNAPVIATLRMGDPPRETLGFARDAAAAVALPLSMCEWNAPCDRDYEVTFMWRGPAPSVAFAWHATAEVRSYGLGNASPESKPELNVAGTSMLPAAAPIATGSIGGSFDVPAGHRWWRGIGFSWTGDAAAPLASGDPFVPLYGTLLLRATDTSGTTGTSVRLHIQGAGWVDVPLNGQPVTVGWAPDHGPWCGRPCTRDAFFVIARLDPGSNGPAIQIDWTGTVVISSFAEGVFPATTTLSMTCRNECKAEDLGTQ